MWNLKHTFVCNQNKIHEKTVRIFWFKRNCKEWYLLKKFFYVNWTNYACFNNSYKLINWLEKVFTPLALTRIRNTVKKERRKKQVSEEEESSLEWNWRKDTKERKVSQLELIKKQVRKTCTPPIYTIPLRLFWASKNVATQSEISIGDHYTAFSLLRTYHVA